MTQYFFVFYSSVYVVIVHVVSRMFGDVRSIYFTNLTHELVLSVARLTRAIRT